MEPLTQTLSPHWNWVRVVRGKELVFRYMCEDSQYVWVMRIGRFETGGRFVPEKPPSTPAYREKWKRRDVERLRREERIKKVAEQGIPIQMREAVPPEDEGKKLELEFKREVVSFIMNKWGHSIVLESACRIDAIQETLSTFEVSRPSVVKWTEFYLFYGGHPNSLIDQDWRKGGKDEPRRGLRDANGRPVVMGRPTDAERIDPNTSRRRSRFTLRRYEEFRTFVEAEAWETDDSIQVIVDRFVLTREGHNRAEDGTSQAFRVDVKHLPNRDYMEKVGRELVKRCRHERDKMRSEVPGFPRQLAGGNAQDIVRRNLTVFDIDATVADLDLWYGEDLMRIDGSGGPTVTIAVDRRSSAIVGWYVTFGTENGDCYINCVFSAYTSKETELERWGMQHLKGMVHGCAAQIFCDRGPGISKKVVAAVVKRLRTDSIMARPGDGPGKGHAEQVMGMAQREVAHLPGSTHPTGDEALDARRRRRKKKDAVLGFRTFMQALLSAISKRNLTMDVRHLLTEKMLESGVRPVPIEIFKYNMKQQRGDAAWEWPEEVIFRKLCEEINVPAPGGIVTFEKHEYTSSLLKELAKRHEKMHGGKSLVVKAYRVPNAPLHMRWEGPDGKLERLDATKRTRMQFGDSSWCLHRFMNMVKNKRFSEANHDARSAPSVSETVTPGVISKAKQRKMAAAEANASVSFAEGARQARSQAKARMDEHDANHLDWRLNRTANPAVPEPDEDAVWDVLSVDDEQELKIDF